MHNDSTDALATLDKWENMIGAHNDGVYSLAYRDDLPELFIAAVKMAKQRAYFLPPADTALYQEINGHLTRINRELLDLLQGIAEGCQLAPEGCSYQEAVRLTINTALEAVNKYKGK